MTGKRIVVNPLFGSIYCEFCKMHLGGDWAWGANKGVMVHRAEYHLWSYQRGIKASHKNVRVVVDPDV